MGGGDGGGGGGGDGGHGTHDVAVPSALQVSGPGLYWPYGQAEQPEVQPESQE